MLLVGEGTNKNSSYLSLLLQNIFLEGWFFSFNHDLLWIIHRYPVINPLKFIIYSYIRGWRFLLFDARNQESRLFCWLLLLSLFLLHNNMESLFSSSSLTLFTHSKANPSLLNNSSTNLATGHCLCLSFLTSTLKLTKSHAEKCLCRLFSSTIFPPLPLSLPLCQRWQRQKWLFEWHRHGYAIRSVN